MKVSIVLYISSLENFTESLDSIIHQTWQGVDVLVVSYNANSDLNSDKVRTVKLKSDTGFYAACNEVLALLQGDYVLFLQAGDKLTNDHVLEELVLHGVDEDLVFGNTLISSVDAKTEKHIFVLDSIRVSDLAIKDLPVQSVFFNVSALIQAGGFDITYPKEAARLYCVNGLVNRNFRVRHINQFVGTLTEYAPSISEIEIGLKKYIPTLAEDMLELLHEREWNAHESNRVLKKFGESVLFKQFLKVRTIGEKLGFYDWKAKQKQKRYYKKIAARDAQIRKETEAKIWALPDNMLTRKNDASDIIVSLTTFGHRVTDTAPHSIYTLFTQNRLPNRIILFLDHDNWNANNIPPLLQKLQRSGLEIYFCEDTKPYKKLIPALQLFPDNPIITVDDDVYYNPNTISELVEAYEQSDRKSVICHWAFVVEKQKGKFTPYLSWRDNKFGNKHSIYSAVGQDGVLYPAGIFDEEVFNKEVFMQKCQGDDIWFWIQEYRNGVPVRIISNSSKDKNTFVNTIDQWVPTRKSALYYINQVQGMNNVNMEKLLDYYNLV
jgi:glycosyltransferase involved in cell wall biosynthesis